MIVSNVNKYDDIKPDNTMVVLVFKSTLDIFSKHPDGQFIFDLKNIDEWSTHASIEKEYWIDISLHMIAYKNYCDVELPDSPVYSLNGFLEIIIYGDKNSYIYKDYYKPLLRKEKFKRLIND